jgi:hypothetical protein
VFHTTLSYFISSFRSRVVSRFDVHFTDRLIHFRIISSRCIEGEMYIKCAVKCREVLPLLGLCLTADDYPVPYRIVSFNSFTFEVLPSQHNTAQLQ